MSDEVSIADVMSADEIYEHDRTTEYILDAQDEERWAEEEKKLRTAPLDDDEDFYENGCDGYSPDTWCGECKPCQEAEQQYRDENPED